MMIADMTWYLIFRRVKGTPVVQSRGGVIDAVAAESEARAVAVALERNAVRSYEFASRAKAVRASRQREIKEFTELMDKLMESPSNDNDVAVPE